MLNNRLNETKIGEAKVIVDIVPKGHCIPNVKITPTSITIHQTGNVNASASANHRYMKNINKSGERTASWHFTVGFDEIYQAQSTNYKCYHAGCTSGNNSSIGIEICMYSDAEKQKKAYLNAIELVKIILKYYGWEIDKVKRHYDWTKKHCPAYLIDGKYGYNWDWFKDLCVEKPKVEPPKTEVSDGTMYRVICGSYSKKANAQDQMDKLKAKGFSSFLNAKTVSGMVYYRVVVGSYSIRQNAQDQMDKLKAKGFSAFLEAFKK